MCDVMTALAVGSSLLSFQQGNAVADAQTEAINRNRALQEADLARQQQEQSQAAAAQMNAQARAAMKDMALFDTIAGEFGGGVSADRAASALAIQQGEALATIGKGADSASRQNSFQGLSIQSQANSQLASISRPSVLGTALTIGSSVVGGMDRAAIKKAQQAALNRTPGIK